MDVHGLSTRAVSRTRRGLERLDRLPLNTRPVQLPSDRRDYRKDDRLHFRNDSGETIPAFGCMAVTGITMHLGRVIYIVEKPSTTFRRFYLVNSGLDILEDGFGVAQSGTHKQVLFGDGSPDYGMGYGPKPSAWEAFKDYPETAFVLGEHDDGDTIVCEWHDIHRLLAKSAEAIDKGNSGDFTLYKGPMGSESSIGITLEGHVKFGDVDDDVWCWLDNQSGANWYATIAECAS